MTLAARCRLISALLLDVDGVLTQGEIVYTAGGHEIKAFHVRDGSAIKRWQQAGNVVGILSGRQSTVTALRAKELGIAFVEQGHTNKQPGFAVMLQHLQCNASQVAYIGDDLPDIPVMRQAGLAIAPGDACREAVQAAHMVTRHAGGLGAVSEAIEWILAAQQQTPINNH